MQPRFVFSYEIPHACVISIAMSSKIVVLWIDVRNITETSIAILSKLVEIFEQVQKSWQTFFSEIMLANMLVGSSNCTN